MRDDNLSDIGDPAFYHWENRQCTLTAPGDIETVELVEITCPECLNWLEQLKERRRRVRVQA